MSDYAEFLASKQIADVPTGFEPRPALIPESLFDFQRDIIGFSCRRGRSALFEDCGLGKTAQQLAWANQVCAETGAGVLILAPLCVGEQTIKEAEKFGIFAQLAHEQSEADLECINVTNYEKLHRFDLSKFKGIVLDESSILKSYTGATRNAIIEASAQIPFKLACTATPAPNDYMELGNHAEFLGVMSRTEMLATFFVHDGGDTSEWRLKGHAEEEFWKWICTWAVCIRKPSDLGYADGGFKLPELKLHNHIVDSRVASDGFLFSLPASTLKERRNARRASLSERVAKAAEIANSTDEAFLLWCNLNDESEALADAIDGAVEITGSDSDEHKERAMRGFVDGSIRALVTKPSIAGFGMNWQHCANMALVGLSDSYEQFYQAVRRCWRFGQTQPVNAHIITSQAEGAVLENIKRKEADAQRLASEMVKHMAHISSAEIKGVHKNEMEYNPQQEMKIPLWLN